jgi:hypothetical protein
MPSKEKSESLHTSRRARRLLVRLHGARSSLGGARLANKFLGVGYLAHVAGDRSDHEVDRRAADSPHRLLLLLDAFAVWQPPTTVAQRFCPPTLPGPK